MLKRLIKLNKKTNFHSNSLFLNSEKLSKVAQTSPFDADLEKEKQYRFENLNSKTFTVGARTPFIFTETIDVD
jgi:hypothetical protein